METTQLLNSDSTGDSMESQQHQEPPKGLRSLPRELRDKIYKLVLLPEAHCKTHCCAEFMNGALLASTLQITGTQSPCMDINSICSRAHWKIAPRPAKIASILLVCRQTFQEAAQVLYENTQLRFQPQCNSFETKITNLDWVFGLIPSYALRHIRVLSLAFYVNRYGGLSTNPLDLHIDRAKLPNLNVVKLHFDVHAGNPEAPLFSSLYTIAEHVTFLVDFHITSTFVDDGTGWAHQLLDNDNNRAANQGTYASAWAVAKEKAFELRAAFVKDLGAIFQQHGKELKIKGN